MDENIIIPIVINKNTALAELKKFKSEAQGAVGGIGGGAPGNITVNVYVKTLNAISDLRALEQTGRQSGRSLKDLTNVAGGAGAGMKGMAGNVGQLTRGLVAMTQGGTPSVGMVRSLVGIMMGGGGLGIALGVVGAGLMVGIKHLNDWRAKAEAAKEAAKKLAEEQKQLGSQIAQDIVKLTSLVGITQSHTAKIEDKNKAIKAINQEYGQFLGNLGKEGATLKNVAKAYDQVIDAMVRQAVVKGLQAQISKEVEKTAGEIVRLEMAEKKRQLGIDEATKKLKNQETAADKLARGLKQRDAIVSDGILAQTRANQAMHANVGYNELTEVKVAKLKAQLMETIKPAMQLTDAYDDLGVALKKVSGKKDKETDAEKFAKRFAEYQKELADNIAYLDSSFQKGLISPLEFAEQKLRLLTKASKDFQTQFDQASDGTLVKSIEEQARQLKVVLQGLELKEMPLVTKLATQEIKPKIKVIPELTAQPNAYLQRLASLRKQLTDLGVTHVFDNGIMVPIEVVVDQKSLEVSRKIAETQIAAFRDTIKNAAVDGLSGIGEGLGDALSGVEGLGGIFNRVGSVLGGAMKAFGKEMIQSGITMILAKKAMKALLSNPYTAIAAGIALVAVGTALQNSLQKKSQRQVTGFAYGGTASGAMLAWVGEHPRTSRSNPELFARTDQMEKIAARTMDDAFKDSMNKYALGMPGPGGGGSYPEKIKLIAEGDSLVGVLTRTQNRQKRIF